MKEIDRLEPRAFTRFCMSIGAVPSSYIAGLTIEEQLLWFCSYLEKEVIPAVNNNGEAVTELQNLYIQLKDYVDNYFDNLDIQAEVDSKLDEMAESGELAELISQYLESQAIIGFNTCSALASAQNLAAGSYARTMGRNTYLDGYGAFYRVRERLNSDDPDGYHLIVLTETDNLVAEMIPDATISTIQNNISTMQGQIATINQKLNKKYIFIGDSYNTTDTPTGGTQIVPWSSFLVDSLGLTSSDYYNSGVSGAGWVNGTTFLSQLQTLAGNMTNDEKNSITDIVVLGGINDPVSENANVYTALNTFSTYVATNFPNAMITIGCISWGRQEIERVNLRTKFQIYNFASNNKNMRVLENIFTAYHNYAMHYQTNDGHPNSGGSQTIAYFVANALKGEDINVKWYKGGNITNAGNTLGITDETVGTFDEMFSGDKEILKLDLSNAFHCSINLKNDGSEYTIGTMALNSAYFPAKYEIGNFVGWAYSGGTFTPIRGVLKLYQTGTLIMQPFGTATTINNVSMIFISPGTTFTIPAEYC